MRALVITKHGPPEVLRVLDRPDPEVGPGEVRIAVKAAGMNFSDLLARIGMYPDAPKPPCVIGYELAGDVESVGDGVEGFKPGDRVISGSRFGGQAELVVAKEKDVIALPDGWSYEKGAALPVVYATAYAGMIRYGAVHEGERVLIHAAAGGVGIAATQLGKHLGAELFGTASASKHDAIRGFGIQHAIDYHSQDPAKEIRRITGEKKPLDLVMDAIGGSSFRKSWSLLHAGGRLVAFGISEGGGGERRNIPKALKMVATTPIMPMLLMMRDSKSVIGLNMLTIWDEKGSLDEFIGPLEALIADGVVDPVVSEAFPIEQAADAHRYLGERKNIGKVVLTF
ncbi:MAG TPA: zinc-binding dehydrogenase [Thermoleophilaceae bacterium]|nr:zinc-binding dehydrogenase [Thermoleophilaceae bacterium]